MPSHAGTARLPARIAAWAAQYRGEPPGDLALDPDRVFILPTRAGLFLAMVAVLIWFGSLNFDLQLGYLLAFLVLSVAIVGLYQTHRNLGLLVVRAHQAAPVHAGEVANFDFHIENPTDEARHAITLNFIVPQRRSGLEGLEPPRPGVSVDVAASSSARVSIGLPTRRRGRRDCPRVRLSTRFPFGLWEAWAYASPRFSAVIYPAPEADAPPPPAGHGVDRVDARGVVAGNDDFAGVRAYAPGDPLRAVAWRLAARNDELSVKLFESHAGEESRFDFALLDPGLGTERRLARLARWVLLADAAGLRYSLHLPGIELEADSGPAQRVRCLEALALFGG